MAKDKITPIPSVIAGPDTFKPQSPVPNPQEPINISTISQYSIYKEDGTPLDLPVEYFKFYKALYTTDLMDLVATVGNPYTVKSGVAIYYIEQRATTRNYTQGTKLPKVAGIRTETVPCNYSKEISYTWETLDLEQFGVRFTADGMIMSSAFIASINDRMVKAEMLYNQVKLLNGLKNEAKKNIKITLVKPGEWKEKTPGKKDYVFIDDDSIDAYRKLWKQFTTFIEQARSSVTQEYVGLDINQFTFVVGANLKVMINMFPVNYGDRSSKIIENMDVDRISNVPIKTIPFLGLSNFTTGIIDDDEAFDLTGIDGMLVHKEAYAYPTVYGMNGTFQSFTDGNYRILRKWRTNFEGGKAIRPDLIWGIVIALPKPPTDADTLDGLKKDNWYQENKFKLV